VLAVVATFKARYAPPNDLLVGQGLASLASRFADPARYEMGFIRRKRAPSIEP
jgi:hypothetical protein